MMPTPVLPRGRRMRRTTGTMPSTTALLPKPQLPTLRKPRRRMMLRLRSNDEGPSMMRSVMIAVGLLMLVLAGNCFAQSYRDDVKTSLGFSGWPGKGGSLKPGFVFDPKDHPELNGIRVVDDQREVARSSIIAESIVRRIKLTKSGKEQV